MSIAEHHPDSVKIPIVKMPEVHGDGITVAFKENSDNTTIVTAHDSVRNCEKILRLPTRIIVRKREEVRNHLLHLLTQELNGKPMQVGVFSEGKENDSDTMPE